MDAGETYNTTQRYGTEPHGFLDIMAVEGRKVAAEYLLEAIESWRAYFLAMEPPRQSR